MSVCFVADSHHIAHSPVALTLQYGSRLDELTSWLHLQLAAVSSHPGDRLEVMSMYVVA